MTEQEEIQATLDEHRAWTWNKFKEQNGAHIIGTHLETGASHVFKVVNTAFLTILCDAEIPCTEEVNPTLACWPTCKECASAIYSLCRTSLPEEVSVQSEVSGNSGQLALPNSENWGR